MINWLQLIAVISIDDVTQFCISQVGIKSRKWIESRKLFHYFCLQYSNNQELKNLGSSCWRNQEGHARNSQSWKTGFHIQNEDYIIQMSEETKIRVTNNLYRAFSKTESRFLGASCQIDNFLFNSQIQAKSATVLRTSRNSNTENH